MRARDVMTTKVVSVNEDAPVEDIARTLIKHRISGVPVVNGRGEIVGMVSESDLMRRPESDTDGPSSWWLSLLSSKEERAQEYVKTHGRVAKDVMSQPVVTVHEDTTLEDVADILERRRIKRVPVLDGDKLVGILSRANLMHGLVTSRLSRTATAADETIRTSILDALDRQAGVDHPFINVTVTDGTVHLWGALSSEAEKRAVHLVAENTVGVHEVEDHIGVIPSHLRSVLWAE